MEVDATDVDFVYLGVDGSEKKRPQQSTRHRADAYLGVGDYRSYVQNSPERSFDYTMRFAIWRNLGEILQDRLGYTQKNGARFQMEENVVFMIAQGEGESSPNQEPAVNTDNKLTGTTPVQCDSDILSPWGTPICNPEEFRIPVSRSEVTPVGYNGPDWSALGSH